jgi:hypothetical protein
LCATLIARLLNREFRRRGSMIVLKAFPLEFEGVGPAASGKRVKRRTSALVRLYERRLGMTALPGKNGRAGWMWRALRSPIKPSGPRRKNKTRSEKGPTSGSNLLEDEKKQ